MVMSFLPFTASDRMKFMHLMREMLSSTSLMVAFSKLKLILPLAGLHVVRSTFFSPFSPALASAGFAVSCASAVDELTRPKATRSAGRLVFFMRYIVFSETFTEAKAKAGSGARYLMA